MTTASSADSSAKRSSTSHVTPIVFVVDDDISVREALEGLISYVGWKVETFSSAEAFLARPRVLAPSCLILDLSLPDLNGLVLQERLVDRIDMPIIFVTGYCDIPTTVRAMKAGAVEFLTKPIADATLLNAVERALRRSEDVLCTEAELGKLQDRYESLSRREQEVMVLVVSGLMNKQVAGRLGISEITVKAHRGKVMRKMAAGSLADLVKMATTLRVAPQQRPKDL